MYSGKKEKSENPVNMPTKNDLISEVQQIISRLKRPEIMPHNPTDAARWWVGRIMQPHQDVEAPHRIPVRGGGYRWEWAYAMRVIHCLKLFMSLGSDFQRYIVAAAEDGIWWRGDEFKFFRGIVAETEKMRSVGAKEYRRRGERMLDAATGKAA